MASGSTSSRFERPRGWRRLRPRRPYHQVALLVTLFLVVGATIAGLMQPKLAHIREHAVEAERVRPVVTLYSQWERAEIATLSSLMTSAQGDVGERAAFLAEASANWTQMQQRWNEYADAALGSGTETELRRDYRVRYEEFSDVAYPLLSAPTAPTLEQLTELAQSYDELRASMEAIRVYYLEVLSRATQEAAADSQEAEDWHRWAVAGGLAALVVLALVVLRSLRRRDRSDVATAQRADLETRVQRALEMIRDESGAYAVVGEALAAASGGHPAELLVADSSRAHLHQVAVAGDDNDWTGCSVPSPAECPAAVRAQTQVFGSSTDLDACPYLTCPSGHCSAVCVPLTVGGKAVGVVHAKHPDKRPPGDDAVASSELIARKAGERIAMLRAFSRSQAQAQTDALTGLLNRRSIEDRVYELDREGTRYVVAYADLDHFKMLNDVHGHEVGDRALRLFARVLRESIRPNDIPARYGGEEFVVVLPDCDTTAAVAIAERIRSRLAESLDGSTLPSFTVSIGLAGFDPGSSFSESVERADGALLVAKRSGRNQTVVAGDADAVSGASPAESAVDA